MVKIRANAPDVSGKAPDGAVPAAPHLRLIAVAREMFCRDGIHATGIDRILAAAGVSKMTLYTRFGSKEALVREVLRQEGIAWRDAFFMRVRAASDAPARRLGHIVAALGEWFGGERFYGCAFMNAIAEHSKGEAWLRSLAAEHHREILGFLAAEAERAGANAPERTARQLMLLIDGAIAAYMVSGDLAVLEIADLNLHAILSQSLPAATALGGDARGGLIDTAAASP